LDLRERRLAAPWRRSELSDRPARRRLDLRERQLVASWVSDRPGSSAFELRHAAAGGRLVLRQRRLGAAKLAARTR
jgi:hypothetical protein